MNLFPGGSVSGNSLVMADFLIPLPRLISSLVVDEQSVTLGIRPEAITISTTPTRGNGFQLPGEVEGLESDFVHRMQTVHVCSGRFHYAVLCSMDVDLRIGQTVHASLDPNRLHFFDTISGLRL
jgi:ABC-type sugar transport system ATPase subunit